MSADTVIPETLVFLGALLVLSPPLGAHMARVYDGERSVLHPVLGWLERLLLRAVRVDPSQGMDWKSYARNLLVFNALGAVLLFSLLCLQHLLPGNPGGVGPVDPLLAGNIAISFMTNTNWQAYAGETTLSLLSQMAGLTVQNFLSAATGMSVLIALIRGFRARGASSIGNVWSDIIRSVVYILLPLSLLLAMALAVLGVPQTLSGPVTVTTLEGREQIVPLGPVASQVAIKQLGSNGGGYFNGNSAHPFENPTPTANMLELLAILLIASALTHTFGRMVGSTRQGWTLWSCMMLLFLALLGTALWADLQPNPSAGLGSMMEGREQRIGPGAGAVWTVATTSASNGSVNAMHDSSSPLAGMSAMLAMMLGEIVFGGVGAGTYGMVMFVILAVFIAGLMVGRTPEWLGKKIESHDIRLAILAVLLPNACILIGAAIAAAGGWTVPGGGAATPHDVSRLLYAMTSASQNNGSAFAGYDAGAVFALLATGVQMLAGRFGVIIPALALAGSMAGKRITPASSGTFRTDTPTFAVLLIAVILIVGALTFLPFLSLGPILEQTMIGAGTTM